MCLRMGFTREGLISTDRLAPVKVRVDTGIKLVQQVALMRASGVRGRSSAREAAGAVGSVGSVAGGPWDAGGRPGHSALIGGSTVVAVGVNTGVKLVGYLGVVWAVGGGSG